MRAGVTLYASDAGETAMGEVTSGGFGPSVEAPLSMGFVDAASAQAGTTVWGEVRGKRLAAEVVALPFVEPGFKR